MKQYHWITKTAIWIILLCSITAALIATALIVDAGFRIHHSWNAFPWRDYFEYVVVMGMVAYGICQAVCMIYLLKKNKRGLDLSLTNTAFGFLIMLIWFLSYPGIRESLLWPSLFAGIGLFIEMVLLLSLNADKQRAYDVLDITDKRLYLKSLDVLNYMLIAMWLCVVIAESQWTIQIYSLALCFPMLIGCILISCKQPKAGYIIYFISLALSILLLLL